MNRKNSVHPLTFILFLLIIFPRAAFSLNQTQSCPRNSISRGVTVCNDVIVDHQVHLDSAAGRLNMVKSEQMNKIVSGTFTFAPTLTLPTVVQDLGGMANVWQTVPLYFSSFKIAVKDGAGFSIENIQTRAEGARIAVEREVTIAIELSWKIIFDSIFSAPPIVTSSYHLNNADPVSFARQNFENGALEGNAYWINVQVIASEVTEESAVLSLLLLVYGTSESISSDEQIRNFNIFAEELVRTSQLSFTAIGPVD